jgi:GNAT superfamily N-acetyltransferase
MQIVRVIEALPEGFDALLADALAEGVNNMALLAAQWADGDERFDGPDEGLFAGLVGGEMAGVGGVTRETGAGEPAMRMRRLYVRPAFRRSGLGRTLAGAMMQQGFAAAPLLTANARATPAAPPFWEAMGFAPADRPGFTHWLRAC